MPRSRLALLLTVILLLGLSQAYGEESQIRVAMLEKSAATFYVPGAIDGYGPVELMVDTGSGYMTINEGTLEVLKRKGAARYLKQLQGVLADGSELVVPVYTIERMSIGANCWLTNVEAAVFPGTARQILGLSALRKVAPFVFSIDPPGLMLSRCGGMVGGIDNSTVTPVVTANVN